MHVKGAHPLADLFPMMKGEQMQDLIDDIRHHGQREPILVDEDGLIVDGRNRYQACCEAGVEAWIEPYDLGDEGSVANYVISMNVRRRHLNTAQRAYLAAKVLLPVETSTRLEFDQANREKKAKKRAKDGKTPRQRAAEKASVSTASVNSAKKVIDSGNEQLVKCMTDGEIALDVAAKVVDLPEEKQAEAIADPKSARAIVAALTSSASCEWYTPAIYVDAARYVLGGISLDPASCAEANETVQAEHYFDAQLDGLTKDWHGTVFCNPPYGKARGKSLQAVWASRMIRHYNDGLIDAGILLVNASIGTSWFKHLWGYPICFVDQRIRFRGPAISGEQPTHGNAFVYFGDEPKTFVERFREFGHVTVPDGVGGYSVTIPVLQRHKKLGKRRGRV